MKALERPGLSLWAATANSPPATRPLEGERRADVVIVGAGYTGLSCAVHLADAGRETVVLEARGIGHGGSGPAPLTRRVARGTIAGLSPSAPGSAVSGEGSRFRPFRRSHEEESCPA